MSSLFRQAEREREEEEGKKKFLLFPREWQICSSPPAAEVSFLLFLRRRDGFVGLALISSPN